MFTPLRLKDLDVGEFRAKSFDLSIIVN